MQFRVKLAATVGERDLYWGAGLAEHRDGEHARRGGGRRLPGAYLDLVSMTDCPCRIGYGLCSGAVRCRGSMR